MNIDYNTIKNLTFDDVLELGRRGMLIGAACVVVLMSIIFWYFFVSPEESKLAALRSRQAQLESSIANKKDMIAVLPLYEAQIKVMNERFKKFLKQLPSKTQIPSLLSDITADGRTSGLSFGLFKPLDYRSKKFYQEIPVHIIVTGTYGSIGGFVGKVSELPRIVTINDISLHRIPFKDKKSTILPQQIQMSCTAVTYRYNDTVIHAKK